MKYIYIIYFALSLSLFSCDDRNKKVDRINTPPRVTFNNNLFIVDDSIKLSLKHSQNGYPFTLNLSDDENNIDKVTYEIQTGTGKILLNNIDQNGVISSHDKNVNLTFVPGSISFYQINFTATDKFNKSYSAKLRILGFSNLDPVASFSYVNKAIVDKYEYWIDASKSYDRDAKFGGGVVWYKYKINSEVKLIQESTLKYIFPKSGNYIVTVSVQDNDGVWSSEVSQTIPVQ